MHSNLSYARTATLNGQQTKSGNGTPAQLPFKEATIKRLSKDGLDEEEIKTWMDDRAVGACFSNIPQTM